MTTGRRESKKKAVGKKVLKVKQGKNNGRIVNPEFDRTPVRKIPSAILEDARNTLRTKRQIE